MNAKEREARLAEIIGHKRVAEDNDPANVDINSVAGLIELVRLTLPITSAIEIGSNLGVSTEVFCLFAERVVCVDPWSDPKADIATKDARYKAFCKRTERYAHLEICRDYSPKAAMRFADESFDLLYLDADHHYVNVKQDLLAWMPKVKRGGFIAGHDYNTVEPSFGVIQAVHELLGKPEKIFSDTSYLYRRAA